VETHEHVAAIYFDDGGKVLLRSVEGSESIKRRIEDAQNTRGSAGSVLEALDRRDRPYDEWIASLSNIMDVAHFRSAAANVDQLLRVVEDGSVDPGRRIGAALAARSHDDDAPNRIRIAAAACADDEMRAALEKAAEGEAEAAIIDALVRRAQ
jgi:hypothetical protein